MQWEMRLIAMNRELFCEQLKNLLLKSVFWNLIFRLCHSQNCDKLFCKVAHFTSEPLNGTQSSRTYSDSSEVGSN